MRGEFCRFAPHGFAEAGQLADGDLTHSLGCHVAQRHARARREAVDDEQLPARLAARQRAAIGFGIWFQSLGLELRQDERVDGIANGKL